MTRLKLSVDLGENYNDPLRFVECAVVADDYGFDTVWFGDHLMPWMHNGNRSAFVWSVMPVALDRTKNIRIGPDVTCPIGGRYHPIIIAQAAATLDNMYPGRFCMGVGSGEAVGEALFFPSGWPKWLERTKRLAEAIVLIKKSWTSNDYFTFEGEYFKIENFFLYTKPKSRIPIYFSAIGKQAARFAGTFGDHLVTINSPELCREIVFPTFDSAARKSGRDPSKMEKIAVLDLFFGEKVQGMKEVRKSGEAGILAEGAFEQRDPRKIQEMSADVSDSKILANKFFISSPDELIELIDKYWQVGATHVDINTHSFPDRIRTIGSKVVPYFTERKDDYVRME
jgi:coenzyme F420-dependent glucose-6-phosphate dehydrogenase